MLGALGHAALTDVPGVFNVAGDGRLTWSDVCAIVGRRRVALPPYLTGRAAKMLRRLGVLDLPAETLDLLRFGRGVDNSRYKQSGFRYRYTSAGTVEDFSRSLRLAATVGYPRPYRYDPAVEDFFRRSPAVTEPRRPPSAPQHPARG